MLVAVSLCCPTTTISNDYYIHGPRGLHAQTEDVKWGNFNWGDGNHWGGIHKNWQHPLTDGLGSVRSVVDASQTVLETRRYTPYGMLDASTGTPQTDFGFTGEWTDENDLLYLRARYYAPGRGTFTALDPFEGTADRPMSLNGYTWVEGNTPNDAVGELLGLLNGYSYANANPVNDAVGEPGFHNRYSYTGGNPVNRVDRNGMCWQHSGSTNEQKNQCNSAFNAYTNEWRQVYGNENRWPSNVMQSYRQEGRYWSGLSYNEFVRQWNSSRPAGHMTAEQRLQQGATLALGGAAITGPTPDDILLLAGALCLYAASQAALAGSIALPIRPQFAFSQASFDYDAAKQTAVAELARRVTEPVMLFRGTAMSRVFQREGLYDNRLWVFKIFMEAVGYAQRDGLIEQDTAAVAAYAMNKMTFDGFVASGNIRVRFGIEYGLDQASQSFLIGPVVIPVPDS